MKRIITLVALIGLIVAAYAQTNTLVTLDHNGEQTFFDNVNGLSDAITAAVDGDKIYLSSGIFVSPSKITMDKAVSIIGNGYDTHILPEIEFNFTEDKTYAAPAFEGVFLEKLSNSKNTIYTHAEITLRTCKIRNFDAFYFKSITIDRCYIGVFDNYGSKTCEQVNIMNSKIESFKGDNAEIVGNCNIGEITASNYNPKSLSSSIVNSAYLESSRDVVMVNCLIGKNTYTGNTGKLILDNCYRLEADAEVLDGNLECTIDLVQKGYLGTDGTQVGVYGGEWMPYTTVPTLPTVDKSASSVTYDAENNQLKVNIKIME